VKIVAKLEKNGQVLAQSELEVHNPEKLQKRTGSAFKQFRKDHPEVSLLDPGVSLKFEKVD
jgi:hypothetical protein